MKKPVIVDLKPMAVTLSAGDTKAWCSCGLSSTQPYCNGAHAGSDFTPTVFSAGKDGESWLCLCKHTGNPPYCDGTHATLEPPEEPTTSAGAGETTVSGPPSGRNTPVEPHVEFIHALARDGLKKFGHHGPMGAMGVPRTELPAWDDIQILTAQLASKPLSESEPVATELVIGPNAEKPLRLDIPLFVSDMSFGALSEEAKISLARGAELAGTAICSGEGGMLPEEQAANGRYMYELASAGFGYDDGLMASVQAFHFKGGQGAKTGTGGHLPGEKVTAKIAQVRGLKAGQDAVSPPTFADLATPGDFRRFADKVRALSGGIPVGFKLSANHIEDDIDFALAAGADNIILDGRGGGTGAAPLLFRDHISVPT